MPKFKVYLSGKAEIDAVVLIEADSSHAANKKAERMVNGPDIDGIDWEVGEIDPFDVDIGAIREIK